MSNDASMIRVFVAATPSEWLPTQVLAQSIRETTHAPVEVTPIYTLNRAIPAPKSRDNKPRTPFSFQRFLIPEACGYSGRAIYLDSDMLVFHDIAQLWNHPLGGLSMQTVASGNDGRRGQFSVMLLDNEQLAWNIDDIVAQLDSGQLTYARLMYDMCLAPSIGYDISPAWNSLERYEPGRTSLLHYTDMNTQPWVSLRNPVGHLWVACLRRAISAGFITEADLIREIEQGHVRPSLALQMQGVEDDTRKLGAAASRADRDFTAPYRRLQVGRARPWTSLRAAARALARRLLMQARLG